MSPLPGPNLSNVPEISARALISSLERDHVKTETGERERNGERRTSAKKAKTPPSFSPFSEDFTWKALIFDRREAATAATQQHHVCFFGQTSSVASLMRREGERGERREREERGAASSAW